ncbi:MAG: VOC family protein [Bacteroidales bacterium]|jgi:catechol 2,3-dioxygenase-like lactoylglutathione lyase family enzyme|nr:VOC family protein [Bacteroidales bacterium]MCK4637870.1 VOC family protein [Bacteroidales bacterium]
MKLEHIALTISDPAEIKNFYQDILGVNEARNFILNKVLAEKIFSIPRDTSFYYIQKDKLFLEIFISPGQNNQNFNHICLSIKNRELLVEKICKRNYEYVRIKRELSDLIFIKDKSGNIFEIKEK